MSREKPASEKKPAGKALAEKTAEEVLRGEIADVCGLLDEESLVFLKRQADVLLHNRRVEKLRREALEGGVPAGQEEGRDPASLRHPPERGVRIERITDTAFNIYVGRKRVFFNRDEMRGLARICHAAENSAEGGKRLFAWLKRERMDFLIDTDTESSSSSVLAELCDLIVHTYKVKEE
jgi:hypothetical protein